MQRILVDTSVWIDYVSKRPSRRASELDALQQSIQNDEVVTLLPILSELRSGSIHPRLSQALDKLALVDLDWNAHGTWRKISELGHRFAGIGVVDRMILLAARERSCRLLTFDRRLDRAANELGVGTASMSGAR